MPAPGINVSPARDAMIPQDWRFVNYSATARKSGGRIRKRRLHVVDAGGAEIPKVT